MSGKIRVFNTAISIFDGHLAAPEYGCFLLGHNTSQAAIISSIRSKKNQPDSSFC